MTSQPASLRVLDTATWEEVAALKVRDHVRWLSDGRAVCSRWTTDCLFCAAVTCAVAFAFAFARGGTVSVYSCGVREAGKTVLMLFALVPKALKAVRLMCCHRQFSLHCGGACVSVAAIAIVGHISLQGINTMLSTAATHPLDDSLCVVAGPFAPF